MAEYKNHGHLPWLTRNLKVVSGVSFLQDAASEMLYPVLPIFLTSVLGAPAAVVGVAEGVAEGAAAVTKSASGRLSDRFRRTPLIGLGYGLAALGEALIAVATMWPMVLTGRCVDRLGKGIRGTPRDALIRRRHTRGSMRQGLRVPPRHGHGRRRGRPPRRSRALPPARRTIAATARRGRGPRDRQRRLGRRVARCRRAPTPRSMRTITPLRTLPMAKVRDGSWHDHSRGEITYREYVETVWLPSRHIEASSLAAYQSYLNKHFFPFFGKQQMGKILPSDVQRGVTTVTAGGLSPASVRKYHTMLHSVFKRVTRDRIITFNPCEDTELPKVVNKQARTLSPVEY